jgi:hypothetical protein
LSRNVFPLHGFPLALGSQFVSKTLAFATWMVFLTMTIASYMKYIAWCNIACNAMLKLFFFSRSWLFTLLQTYDM